MRKIQSKDLAQLLLQLRFTPKNKRRKQLNAAEKLYAVIEENREYPFEFVFFRIIGFIHKDPIDKRLLKGDQLREDLRIFIAKLSGQLAVPVSHQRSRVYGSEELAEVLGISMRTLLRWRKRGLIARKFIFEDGVKRLGFFKRTVDEFLAANPDLAGRAKGFTRLTAAQKRSIIKRAGKLAGKKNLSRHQVIAKIADDLGRAHETIRSILVSYEKANPDKPLFKRRAGVTDAAEAAEIYELFKEGTSIKDLTEQFDRSRSSIYRIINVRRAKGLLRRKIEFIAGDEFLEANAREVILGKEAKVVEPAVGTIEPFGLADGSLTDYLRVLKKTQPLNRETEVELFRRYNYLKYLACIARAGMKSSRASGSLIEKIEGYLKEAENIQKTIVEANLRLVVSIARKHTAGGANLTDLISEGNYSLMRAIEKFDYSRGFRFATFASWTIAKDYARKVSTRTTRPTKQRAASLARMQADQRGKEAEDLAAIERAHQSLAQVIAEELDRREQYVILHRFGPIGQPIKKKTKTLKQIGEDLDLSKERVRQIELSALQKLRQSLSPKEFELLTR